VPGRARTGPTRDDELGVPSSRRTVRSSYCLAGGLPGRRTVQSSRSKSGGTSRAPSVRSGPGRHSRQESTAPERPPTSPEKTRRSPSRGRGSAGVGGETDAGGARTRSPSASGGPSGGGTGDRTVGSRRKYLSLGRIQTRISSNFAGDRAKAYRLPYSEHGRQQKTSRSSPAPGGVVPLSWGREGRRSRATAAELTVARGRTARVRCPAGDRRAVSPGGPRAAGRRATPGA